MPNDTLLVTLSAIDLGHTKMSDKELVDEIHSSLSGSDMLGGISLCFALATDRSDKAANIFAAYRPKIIDALHDWARDVNGHRGVFLPYSLFGSEASDTYEEMRKFEDKFGDIIDIRAQASQHVRKHVHAANSMEAERHAITKAIERWRTDREARKLCGTNDPERLDKIETTAIEIASDLVKKTLKKEGITINKVDPGDLRNIAIMVVKKDENILVEALRRERVGQKRERISIERLKEELGIIKR